MRSQCCFRAWRQTLISWPRAPSTNVQCRCPMRPLWRQRSLRALCNGSWRWMPSVAAPYVATTTASRRPKWYGWRRILASRDASRSSQCVASTWPLRLRTRLRWVPSFLIRKNPCRTGNQSQTRGLFQTVHGLCGQGAQEAQGVSGALHQGCSGEPFRRRAGTPDHRTELREGSAT